MKVAEIKSELDNLGMTYNSGLRKAELLALLQVIHDLAYKMLCQTD